MSEDKTNTKQHERKKTIKDFHDLANPLAAYRYSAWHHP
jgi:hypothetical protein